MALPQSIKLRLTRMLPGNSPNAREVTMRASGSTTAFGPLPWPRRRRPPRKPKFHSDRFACFRHSFFCWKATSRCASEVVLTAGFDDLRGECHRRPAPRHDRNHRRGRRRKHARRGRYRGAPPRQRLSVGCVTARAKTVTDGTRGRQPAMSVPSATGTSRCGSPVSEHR
jgi:hypothetical protein